MKEKDHMPDVKVTADDATKKLLSSLFGGCSVEQAAAILVNAAGKNRGSYDSQSKEWRS